MNKLSVYCGNQNLSLARSQSDALIVDMATRQRFVVAAWRHDEPIVYGIGQSEWSAQNMARRSDCPIDAELCRRVDGAICAWRGPSGRVVTIEHLLTIDD